MLSIKNTKSPVRSLVDEVLSFDGKYIPSEEIHQKVESLFVNLFAPRDDYYLANEQLANEQHIRSLQTKKGINFRE
jgi:uncharacterized protein (DUF1919 family)